MGRYGAAHPTTALQNYRQHKGGIIMKEPVFILFIVLTIVTVSFIAYATTQVTAERVLPSTMYVPGVTIPVSIKISGEPGPLTIIEIPPAGWSITGIISHRGTFDHGVISWNLPSFMGYESLQYKITPLSVPHGEASFSGRVNEQGITGMTGLEPAELTAERTLPAQGYLPEQSIIIEIVIQCPAGEYTITETPPDGWTAWKISNNGKFENGVIQWTQSGRGTGPLVLTYWLTVPLEAAGPYEFTGTINDQMITGQSTLLPHVPETVGIFTDHCDFLGKGKPLGAAQYDPATGEYEIVGANPLQFEYVYWGFHMAYIEMSGNVTLQAKVHPIQLMSTDRYAGVAMGFFDSVAQGSKCFYERVYAVEPTPAVESIWRTMDSSNFAFELRYLPYTDYNDYDYELKVSRDDNLCRTYYRHAASDEWILFKTILIEFHDPVIVFVHARSVMDPNVLCKGIFSEVEIINESISSVQDWTIFQ